LDIGEESRSEETGGGADIGEESRSKETGGVGPAVSVVDADERIGRGVFQKKKSVSDGEASTCAWFSMARFACAATIKNSPAACDQGSLPVAVAPAPAVDDLPDLVEADI